MPENLDLGFSQRILQNSASFEPGSRMMESIQAAGERREHTPKMSAVLESHQNLLPNYVSMSERDKVLKIGSSWCALQ